MGPFSPDEIYAMLDRGEITGQDFAWADGLPDWQPLSSLPPPSESSTAPPPQSPSTESHPQTLLATVIGYAIGIALCVVGIIAQEAHRQYSAPVTVSPGAAEFIGSISAVAVVLPGLLIWHRYFKGRPGSIMGLIGFIGAGKEVAGFLGRVLISTL